MKEKIPAFKSDRAAERFVAIADLAGYDLSEFRPTPFRVRKGAPPVRRTRFRKRSK
jgi:hypothetical protein